MADGKSRHLKQGLRRCETVFDPRRSFLGGSRRPAGRRTRLLVEDSDVRSTTNTDRKFNALARVEKCLTLEICVSVNYLTDLPGKQSIIGKP